MPLRLNGRAAENNVAAAKTTNPLGRKDQRVIPRIAGRRSPREGHHTARHCWSAWHTNPQCGPISPLLRHRRTSCFSDVAGSLHFIRCFDSSFRQMSDVLRCLACEGMSECSKLLRMIAANVFFLTLSRAPLRMIYITLNLVTYWFHV